MKKFLIFIPLTFILFFALGKISFACPKQELLDLKKPLSKAQQEKLQDNGFVVTPGQQKEIDDIYIQSRKKNQPIFVTTDSVLHTSHIFFDYLLRILEIEKLFGLTQDLTDRMLELSIEQYKEASEEGVRQAARLNIGFFSVPKKIFDPQYETEYSLDGLVNKELSHISSHEGLRYRELLAYVENPNKIENFYAYEDYSQYVPRGHYTRNPKFKRYFKVMMWYGRMDFKLKPGETKQAVLHGKKMTLQALLIVDALMRDEQVFQLWKKIYEPTVYLVGKTDDLDPEDYFSLMKKIFPSSGKVDMYGKNEKLSEFIQKALHLSSPQILSGLALAEKGGFEKATQGFRFMGQRFIPDSYMFQELVFKKKREKNILTYTGEGKPFTMGFVPMVGPARVFPRGLDVMAVLESERALEILEEEGDTEYKDYHAQLSMLRRKFSSLKKKDWTQNIYWNWLHCLRPLVSENIPESAPHFMQNTAWMDKQLQTALGSWTELRHDTILYAKQSYTMFTTALPAEPSLTLGYVEPYPEIYSRIQSMMEDLRKILSQWGLSLPGILEKIKEFEDVLSQLSQISEKELKGQELSEQEYRLIWNIGSTLSGLKDFPSSIQKKITSGTDERMDIVADVHTDLNTEQVLEEGVGSPFNIYVVIQDGHGRRICRGGVFSYYEFKHPLDDRLTDERWQEMGKQGNRPPQSGWTQSFILGKGKRRFDSPFYE